MRFLARRLRRFWKVGVASSFPRCLSLGPDATHGAASCRSRALPPPLPARHRTPPGPRTPAHAAIKERCLSPSREARTSRRRGRPRRYRRRLAIPPQLHARLHTPSSTASSTLPPATAACALPSRGSSLPLAFLPLLNCSGLVRFSFFSLEDTYLFHRCLSR